MGRSSYLAYLEADGASNLSDEPSTARTEVAFKAGGYADMRPVYRAILKRLKQKDAVLFDEATARYQETLEPALADRATDPVTAWVEYGAWLAGKLTTGRLVRLDESGFATSSEAAAEPGQMLLYLPDEKGESAIPLLRPAEPSPAQQAAVELLTR